MCPTPQSCDALGPDGGHGGSKRNGTKSVVRLLQERLGLEFEVITIETKLREQQVTGHKFGSSCLKWGSGVNVLFRQEEFIIEYMNMPGTFGFYRPWVRR